MKSNRENPQAQKSEQEPAKQQPQESAQGDVGTVILVGAGPGGKALLTLGGAAALQAAEAVVYDRLVDADILALIPPHAERVDVGKENNHHPVPQDEINALLVKLARQGKQTVRLKGGDCFLFGRGGEECAYLRAHDIPFAVIPGVTSALAAPAFAGIPVTHRDYCSSVHIVTAHARAGKALHIDFARLVKLDATLVFLMGLGSLEQVMDGLQQAGMAFDTPAAVIENGTRGNQRKVIATIADIAGQVRAVALQSPALIVVGRVCALSEQLDWFTPLPLHGKTIVVTRPRERAGTLAERLRRLGANVIECPCIATQEKPDSTLLESALQWNQRQVEPGEQAEQAGQGRQAGSVSGGYPASNGCSNYSGWGNCGGYSGYNWVVFTSPAGVQAALHALLRLGRDFRALYGMQIAAIGQGTAAALAAYGLTADLVPAQYDSAHLATALLEQLPPVGAVLLLRAQKGSPVLVERLRAAGHIVTDVPLYDTVYIDHDAEPVRRLLAAGKLDVVTFTSVSTVEGFVHAMQATHPMPADAAPAIDYSGFTALCIGEQTAQAAQRYHMRVKIAPNATIDDMIACLLSEA